MRKSVQVNVAAAPLTPVTTFTGTYPGQSNLTTLNLPAGGGNVTLNWSVTNAVGGSCTGYSTTNLPGWSSSGTGGKSIGGSTVVFVASTTRFDLDCWNGAGTAAVRKSVQVNVVAAQTYTVTITAGPGGTTSPIGVVTVAEGVRVPTISIIPAGSNTVQSVRAYGVDFGPRSSFDFGTITSNQTLDVTFNIVAATCGSRQGGTPSSPQVVTASTSGAAVWGSGPFTNDSDLGRIARFLGVPLGWTATLSIADLGCVSSFTGSTANGITTFGWSEYRGMSVSVISQVPPAGQPDLMSQNLSLVTAGPYTQNVTVQVGAWAINNGTVGTLLGFTDRFEYQYNGTGGAWSNFPGQSTIVNGALAAGTPVVDQLGFNPPSVGSIYFRHCVDINNVIPESDNNNNCAVIGPITINAPLAPSRLDICPASATVNVGGTQPFAAYFTNQGTVFDGCSGTSTRSNMVASTTWGTTNASVATVSTSGNRGVVTGQSAGGAAITATFGGLVAPNAPVTVINACVRSAQCTDAGAVATAANTCAGSTFTISDACGTYSCSGIRSCDYNWKEVAP